jgi:hypothetical protein
MKSFLFFFSFLAGLGTSAQTVLRGTVTDAKGRPLPGANVFLKGTYDGTSTDAAGTFRFETTEKDTATLAVSFVGYEPFSRKITLTSGEQTVPVKLREVANELNTVTITAGAFEASDEKKMTMLKPLDIVTTAGAGADITGVMQLLPGAQRNGEATGLFVRGGDASETKVVMDGLIVQNPFNSQTPDVQQRGRFNPFMFKGTSFSTGGYSAQYGQALSSVLLLNTTDQGTNNGLGVSLNLVSAALNYDVANEKQSLSAVGYYGNLAPLFALVKQNLDWQQTPEFLGASLTHRYRTSKTGLLKTYAMVQHSTLALRYRNPVLGDGLANGGPAGFALTNGQFFLNSTYADTWAEGKWRFDGGVSYSHNQDDIRLDTSATGTTGYRRFDERLHGRAVLTRVLGSSSVLVGAEAYTVQYRYGVTGDVMPLRENYGAAFVEGEIYLSRALAARVGLRGEYSSLVAGTNLAPRLSLAYKTGPYSQVSLAVGQFYQTPNFQYYYLARQPGFERADHLILNYQVMRNKRTLRLEAFQKNYAQLVREYTENAPYDPNPNRFAWGRVDNSGYGYARGFDVFWRDQKTFKNVDYWLTYSYLDSRRLFQNYRAEATPTFASPHNFSAIYKQFFTKLNTSFSATYTFTSGRPYFNPNNPVFLADRTPAVHNVSLSTAYLTKLRGNFLVIYATLDNVLGTRNVFTYRYSADGKTRYDVGPATYRSFFLGASLSLSKKAEKPDDFN